MLLTILSLGLQDHDALLCVEVIEDRLTSIEGHNSLGQVYIPKGNGRRSSMFCGRGKKMCLRCIL